MWDVTISGADSIEVNYAKIHTSHGDATDYLPRQLSRFELKSTHPTGDATLSKSLKRLSTYMLKSTHPTGDATTKYSVCSCKKAIVRTNILYFFSSNQIG